MARHRAAGWREPTVPLPSRRAALLRAPERHTPGICTIQYLSDHNSDEVLKNAVLQSINGVAGLVVQVRGSA
jgi:hypothetical protein